MDPSIKFLIFVSGLVIGIAIHPISSLLHGGRVGNLLESFGKLLLLPFRFLRPRGAGSGPDVARGGAESIHEQINLTAQAIRKILLSLATVMQRADQAASDSSHVLADVRKQIGKVSLPPDLAEVHGLLVQEIDRVITSNNTLKRELESAREVLATQREQIENLRTAVRIDSLTQLANRAYFDEKLTELIRLQKRYNEPFSLMMIDVDNFKEINDTYGHQGGDKVLKGIAFKIREVLRESDFVARFGGDEFSVLLVKTKGKNASSVAWKICHAVRESRFHFDAIDVTTTLSIGVAECAPGDSVETILKRADEALYRVKEEGRNGVFLAEAPAS